LPRLGAQNDLSGVSAGYEAGELFVSCGIDAGRHELRGNLREAERLAFRRLTVPQRTRNRSLLPIGGSGPDGRRPAGFVGHRTTIVTQKVYRHQLKPVISTGATAMNAIFSKKSA
jgi:hypothetical protein